MVVGFLPDIDGGGVDGADKGNNPLIQGSALNRDKGNGSAKTNNDRDERPFEEGRKGGGVDN